MAWIKLKSSITNKEITMTEEAFKNFHRANKIFTVIEEQKQTKQEPKSKQPKEETKNVEKTQLNQKYEVDPSGKDNKKA